MPEEQILPLRLLVSEPSEAREEWDQARIIDENLMEKLRRNDSHALDAPFRRYARLVMAIPFRTLRDHGEAEDTVRENVFVPLPKSGSI